MYFLKIILVLPLFMGLDAESASGDFYESGEGEQEAAAPDNAAILKESPLSAHQTAGNSEQEAANTDDLESTNNRSEFIARPPCPPGFTNTVHGFPKCYAVVKEPLTWAEAQSRCGQLSEGGHLAIFTNAFENQVVSEIIRNHDCWQEVIYPRSTHHVNEFWIGGQRITPNNCKSPFVWKLPGGGYLKQSYDNWTPGEPDCCCSASESCMAIRKHSWLTWQWNDLYCHAKTCAICEVLKHVQIN